MLNFFEWKDKLALIEQHSLLKLMGREKVHIFCEFNE